MTDLIPIKCEARLMGLSKVDRKDGEWTQLTFQIHPNDTPYALFLLPLKTHVMLSIKGTEEDAAEPADEQTAPETAEDAPKPLRPVKEHRSWDEVSPREQACIRCNEPEFGKWLIGYLSEPADSGIAPLVRQYCGVGSRADLNKDHVAAHIWRKLDEEYQDHIGKQRLAQIAEQKAAGPT